jgi:DNA-binding transcriptional LysR family regulator
VSWFEEAGVSPRLIHRCNSLNVKTLLVRRGVGVSLLPLELFASDLEAGTLKVLIENPRIPDMDYWAAYLAATDNPLLAEVAALAREESWFLGSRRLRTKRAGAEFFIVQ